MGITSEWQGTPVTSRDLSVLRRAWRGGNNEIREPADLKR
jgi:hypothetical protein